LLAFLNKGNYSLFVFDARNRRIELFTRLLSGVRYDDRFKRLLSRQQRALLTSQNRNCVKTVHEVRKKKATNAMTCLREMQFAFQQSRLVAPSHKRLTAATIIAIHAQRRLLLSYLFAERAHRTAKHRQPIKHSQIGAQSQSVPADDAQAMIVGRRRHHAAPPRQRRVLTRSFTR
jgi:hypothetical protein